MARFGMFFALLGISAAALAEAPTIDPRHDADHFGDPDRILFWSVPEKVAGFRNMARIYPTRRVESGGNPFPLPRAEREFGAFRFEHEGREYTLDEYVRIGNVAGLLILHRGRIVYERYELGNTDQSLWISFSVTKSVTSLLVGAALQDGYINNVDEIVTDYLPRLKGSAYDRTRIRDLLQMASGVAWNEDYADPSADINVINWHTLSVYEYLRNQPAEGRPGLDFNYNTAETNLVGTLVRSAVGNNLSTYLSDRIWRPYGMEFDAVWTLSEPGGGEFGGSSLSATLRDYGRLGQFVLDDGVLQNGNRVLPEGWIASSFEPSKGNPRYGYLWWLRSGGGYGMSGIFGQGIHVVPDKDLVIALQSARANAGDSAEWALQLALFSALEEVERWPDEAIGPTPSD